MAKDNIEIIKNQVGKFILLKRDLGFDRAFCLKILKVTPQTNYVYVQHTSGNTSWWSPEDFNPYNIIEVLDEADMEEANMRKLNL